ncbi:hypothetical protein [Pontivivens ytuae]|uniref:Uncharacterized protein n=1 Tax=Pontivivens ytuae TaxID=2789856 RepID=A0A7S9LTF5_9RHOB|nr:hypothetical protein [Pontivivens ytuae]QPH54927.1 hypothetical protein I0K15_03935 [Pontivivens ytuae]
MRFLVCVALVAASLGVSASADSVRVRGTIDSQDLQRVQNADDGARIYLRSLGGSVAYADDIAAEANDRNMTVVVRGSRDNASATCRIVMLAWRVTYDRGAHCGFHVGRSALTGQSTRADMTRNLMELDPSGQLLTLYSSRAGAFNPSGRVIVWLPVEQLMAIKNSQPRRQVQRRSHLLPDGFDQWLRR